MVHLINEITSDYVIGKGVKLKYVNGKGQKITTGTFAHMKDLLQFIKILKVSHNKARAKLEMRK